MIDRSLVDPLYSSPTHSVVSLLSRSVSRRSNKTKNATKKQNYLQALTAAHVDPRFRTIKERTIGIAFFGTPHRGSEKASYGKVLASVATTVLHRPSSKLVDALQSNSDTLQRLNSDFRFQLVSYQILTFYETRAMSVFSKPASFTRALFLIFS